MVTHAQSVSGSGRVGQSLGDDQEDFYLFRGSAHFLFRYDDLGSRRLSVRTSDLYQLVTIPGILDGIVLKIQLGIPKKKRRHKFKLGA